MEEAKIRLKVQLIHKDDGLKVPLRIRVGVTGPIINVLFPGVGTPGSRRRGHHPGILYNCAVQCKVDGIDVIRFLEINDTGKCWYVEGAQLEALIGYIPDDVTYLPESE